MLGNQLAGQRPGAQARFSAPERRAQIERAASELLHKKGYRALTMRELARHVGDQSASLYHHYPSKQELLRTLLRDTLSDLARAVRTAAQSAGPTPLRQLPAALRAHVLYHGDHRLEAAISDTELRDLSPRNRREIVALRDDYESIFRNILRRGNRLGCWYIDEKMAGWIILGMCTGVNGWYRPDGPLALERIADFYSRFVLRALSVHDGSHREEKMAKHRNQSDTTAELQQRGNGRPKSGHRRGALPQ